ncbi:hypothetical protein B1813_12705 [Saccharomonospora piscinae]|uniref:Secreted protein n=1 Tax=Saccharomonospora piscinae TaxID=687388 RepID=A0A1V9A7E5_SACPI|nr:hypothetical protein [Saccharomonospora piscinae]OQO92968.1 hypothetical protein B1813_12705 [Saccharomonospora piscinae]
MRFVPVLAVLLVAGCGALPAGEGVQCTAIGAPAGVNVDVAPGLAADAAELELCWGGSCRSHDVTLRPATTAVPEECPTGAPDQVCSAQVRPTGGAYGFAQVADLPERNLSATLTVTGPDGARLAQDTVEATPHPVFPNGPECDAAGPQLKLHVAVDGSVTVPR